VTAAMSASRAAASRHSSSCQPVCGRAQRRRVFRVLLPLAPEYIGYADVGLTPGMLLAQPASIRELEDGYFKYCVDFDRLDVPADIGALCVSRPTNPSGNVLTLDELQRLDAIARGRGVPFIIDAAYGLPFPGIQHQHLDSLWNPNVVLCLSLSSWACRQHAPASSWRTNRSSRR